MKTLMKILTIWVLLVAAFFQSCEPIEPTPTSKAPTISVSSNYSSVSYGDSCILTITTENVLTISSEFDSIPASVSFEKEVTYKTTPPLKETTTYHFLATGEKGQVDIANITIYVGLQPLPPTVKITATPDSVLLGSASKLYFSHTGQITSTSVNGQIYTGGSPFSTGPLKEDTKFVVEVTGPLGSAKDSVTVKVNLRKSYLLQNHWYVTLSEGKVDGVWCKFYNECGYSDTTYFYDTDNYGNNVFEDFRVCDGPYHSIGGDYWSLQNNQTVLQMGSVFDIIKLDADTLKLLDINGNTRITYASKPN